MYALRSNAIMRTYVDGLRAAHRLTLRRYSKPRITMKINSSTFTSKTGLTAIFSIIGSIAGLATKTIDPVTAIQTILASAAVFFVRDGITTEAKKVAEAAASAAADAVETKTFIIQEKS
jgi:hypothetical protein